MLAALAAVVAAGACGGGDTATETTFSASQAGTSTSTSSASSGGAGGSTSSSNDAVTTGATGGASTTASTTSSSVTTTSTASSMGGGAGTGGAGGSSAGTIFTILLENHDYNEIVASPNAPYINTLIAQYGLATNYFDSGTHPSLPNYLYLISGATQYPGVLDVGPNQFPYFPSSADNLGNQMNQFQITWRSYQESMGMPCSLSDSGNFATKHDPFLYFSNTQSDPGCSEHNVDYSEFAGDLASGAYRYMWITPNLIDDGHNPTNNPVGALSQADTWLSTEVPKILASTAWQNNGVLFITWDEAEGRNGDSADQVPMIVITPNIVSPGFKSTTAYTHASYLATIEDILGLPRLMTVASAPNMFEFFQ